MNINARLTKIEGQLFPLGCPACAERDKRRDAITGASDPDLDEWLSLYLARCPKCGKQHTFVDVTKLADTELDAITRSSAAGVDVRKLSDEELERLAR